MSVAQLPRLTLRDRAAEALREAVLSGRLGPGAPLVELTLARELGISRAPLREAIRQLVEEGLLVQHRAWGGITVAPLASRRARALLASHRARDLRLRAGLGPAGHSLPRRAAAPQARLTEAIDSGDDLATIETELALHGLVYEASGHGCCSSTGTG